MKTAAICFCILLGFAGSGVYLVSNAVYMVNHTICTKEKALEKDKQILTCHFEEIDP